MCRLGSNILELKRHAALQSVFFFATAAKKRMDEPAMPGVVPHEIIVETYDDEKESKPMSLNDSEALSSAAYNGHTELVKMLLKSGVRQTSETSPFALFGAAMCGHTEIVRMLLESGARQTPKTSPDALEWAAWRGHTEIVKMLLESGARQTPETSHNALGEAASKGHTEIVKMLLESGARQTPKTSSLALQWAVEYNCTEIVGLLLESGARQTPETSHFALLVAVQNGHTEILKMFRFVHNFDEIKERLDDEFTSFDAESCQAMDDAINALLADFKEEDAEHDTFWDAQRIALLDQYEKRCGALLKQMDIETFAQEFLQD